MSEEPLASVEFRRGVLAGSHLSLYRTVLVHRSAAGFETIALNRISTLGVAFERDSGRINQGSVLFAVAALLLMLYWPLHTLASPALSEASVQAQAGGFMHMAARGFDLSVTLLPYVAGGFGVLAIASLALGWVGETVFRVGIAPVERIYASRGRDPLLTEFAEHVAAHIAKRA